MSTSKASPYEIVSNGETIKEIKKPTIKSVKQAFKEFQKRVGINQSTWFEYRKDPVEAKIILISFVKEGTNKQFLYRITLPKSLHHLIKG